MQPVVILLTAEEECCKNYRASLSQLNSCFGSHAEASRLNMQVVA
jgi:hypothetical protein